MEIEIEVENIKDAVDAVCVVVVVASFLTLGKMVPTSDAGMRIILSKVNRSLSPRATIPEPN